MVVGAELRRRLVDNGREAGQHGRVDRHEARCGGRRGALGTVHA